MFFVDVCISPFVQALDLAWNACRELKGCEKFVEVLRYVLAVGNYLNAGSNKGNAYGFSLNTLTKVSSIYVEVSPLIVLDLQLAEFRGNDKKMSLLHYIVQQVHKHEPDILQFPAEMTQVANASDGERHAMCTYLMANCTAKFVILLQIFHV